MKHKWGRADGDGADNHTHTRQTRGSMLHGVGDPSLNREAAIALHGDAEISRGQGGVLDYFSKG
jgi:hypothetical protein